MVAELLKMEVKLAQNKKISSAGQETGAEDRSCFYRRGYYSGAK